MRRLSLTLVAALPALAVLAAMTSPPHAAAGQLAHGHPAGDTASDAASDTAPQVIPALTGWTPSDGAYHFDRRTRILVPKGSETLLRTARTLAEDLQTRYGRPRPVVSLPDPSQAARGGDVVLSLAPDRAGLGAEGYAIDIGTTVHITGATGDGAFRGTRTLLQLLAQGVGDSAGANPISIPAGSTVDVPRYPDRGIGMGLFHYSMPRMERLIKEMSYLKLDYLLFEVPIKSDSHPETVRWPYYTKDEARRIADLAQKYHVTIVPEVNAPGHLDRYLFDRPDLQLTDKNGHRAPGRLDIAKPEAFDFYTDLVDEWTGIFDGPYWDMGADEYMYGTSYANFPQIAKFAKKEYGPDAKPVDAYLGFINKVDDYVQDHGKTLRIWNDGIPASSTVSLHSDIVIEHWKTDPKSGGAFSTLAPGTDTTATFAVTPPADASFEQAYRLTARAGYTYGTAPGKGHAEAAGRSLTVHTDPITCADPPEEPPSPNDEFAGDALDGCRWTSVLDPDMSTLGVTGGHLQIDTQPGSLAGPGGTVHNLALQPAPAGDWTIETKLTAPLDQRYQLGGFLVYGDEDNFVTFDMVADNPAGTPLDPRAELIAEQHGTYGEGGWINLWEPPANPDRTWWLRLTKDGDTYSAAVSADGETWSQMPGTVTSVIDHPRIGLYVTGSAVTKPSIPITFDYFRLS